MGSNSLYKNIDGSSNIAIGSSALYNNTYGSKNIAIGDETLYTSNIGNNSVIIGYGSAKENKGSDNNTVVGYEALQSTTSNHGGTDNNTAVGYQSLKNCNQYGNIGLGYKAGFHNDNIKHGHYNTYIGYETGNTATEEYEFDHSVAIGYQAKITQDNQIVLGKEDDNFVKTPSVYIPGDVSMNKRLFVNNDVSLNNRLYVGSNTIMDDDVSMNKRLFVNKDVSIKNRL